MVDLDGAARQLGSADCVSLVANTSGGEDAARDDGIVVAVPDVVIR